MVNTKTAKKGGSRPAATKSQPNKFKHKGKAGGGYVGKAPFKKAHGKPGGFSKSKEDLKKERAEKFQQRQALRAQKQKELEEERAKAKQEKEEKIRQYKKKRLERTKVLSKKTQRGQPLMKDRMQFLLKQIQEMKKNG